MTVYTVPLYDTLGKQAVEYVIQHSEASIIFVSANNYGALSTALPAVKDQVKTVVVWGGDVYTEVRGLQLTPFHLPARPC